jgi:hypothetical protein
VWWSCQWIMWILPAGLGTGIEMWHGARGGARVFIYINEHIFISHHKTHARLTQNSRPQPLCQKKPVKKHTPHNLLL